MVLTWYSKMSFFTKVPNSVSNYYNIIINKEHSGHETCEGNQGTRLATLINMAKEIHSPH